MDFGSKVPMIHNHCGKVDKPEDRLEIDTVSTTGGVKRVVLSCPKCGMVMGNPQEILLITPPDEAPAEEASTEDIPPEE
jgi:hypothetical protein